MKESREPNNVPVITGNWLLQRLEYKLGEFCSSYTVDDLQDMYDRLLEAAIASDTSAIEIPAVCNICNDIRHAISMVVWNQFHDASRGHSFCLGNEMCPEEAATREIPLQLQRPIIESLETLVPEDFPQEKIPSCTAKSHTTFLPLRRGRCQQRKRGERPK